MSHNPSPAHWKGFLSTPSFYLTPDMKYWIKTVEYWLYEQIYLKFLMNKSIHLLEHGFIPVKVDLLLRIVIRRYVAVENYTWWLTAVALEDLGQLLGDMVFNSSSLLAFTSADRMAQGETPGAVQIALSSLRVNYALHWASYGQVGEWKCKSWPCVPGMDYNMTPPNAHCL